MARSPHSVIIFRFKNICLIFFSYFYNKYGGGTDKDKKENTKQY